MLPISHFYIHLCHIQCIPSFTIPSESTLNSSFSLTLHTPQPSSTPLCGSPRLSGSRETLRESLSCVEFSVEAPILMSPSKSDEFPRKSISPRESLELRAEGMRGLRENLAAELVTGIRKCAHQLWTAHDRLTAGIRDCIGVIVESLADVNSRNLHNYFSRNVLVSKLDRADIKGEVSYE